MSADRELDRFLQQVVLDPELRELARRDPDAAFEGFQLDPADRDVLRRQDPDVLALLGRVLRARLPPPPLLTLGPLTLHAPPRPPAPRDPAQLAAEVRTAPPERRYEAIVELVRALGRAHTG